MQAALPVEKSGNWDLGYEVCFYRDYLWQLGRSPRDMRLPQGRTFDLCLFGTRTLIVIEAKVFQGFQPTQNKDFELNKQRVQSLPGLKDVKVYVVALASSKYFVTLQNTGTLKHSMFLMDLCRGRKQRRSIGILYLNRPDRTYKLKPSEMLDNGPA